MSSPRNCFNGRVRSAESSRLRTRPHVIPVDQSASLTRARAYEIKRSTFDHVYTRKFLENRGKKLRRIGYMAKCHANREAKFSFTINLVLVYRAIAYWYAWAWWNLARVAIVNSGRDQISDIHLCRWKVKIDFGRKVLDGNCFARETDWNLSLLIVILTLLILIIIYSDIFICTIKYRPYTATAIFYIQLYITSRKKCNIVA